MSSKNEIDRTITGPIPDLATTTGAELLADIKQHIQRVWIKTFGLDLIKRELPLAWAKWETDEQRAQFGALPLFLYSWFCNKQKEPKPPEPKPSKSGTRGNYRDTGKDCLPATFEGQVVGCYVHKSHEKCEMEGRR